MQTKDDSNENKTQEEIHHEKYVNRKLTLSAILLILLIFSLTVFGNMFAPSNNQNIGTGDKSITLSIVLPNSTENYAISTNAFTLDEVLMEHDLAVFNHLGTGSIIKSIAGYTLVQDVDWYDIYINEQIVYIQSSHVTINNGEDYKIVIITLD